MTPPDFPVFRIQERVDPRMSYPIIQALYMTAQPTPDQFIAAVGAAIACLQQRFNALQTGARILPA